MENLKWNQYWVNKISSIKENASSSDQNVFTKYYKFFFRNKADDNDDNLFENLKKVVDTFSNNYAKQFFFTANVQHVLDNCDFIRPGKDIALELFDIGYRDNNWPVSAKNVYDELNNHPENCYSADFLNTIRKNMKATFIITTSTSVTLRKFNKYKNKAGLTISKSFPFRREKFIENAIGTAFLVHREPTNPKRGLVVTAAHVVDVAKDAKAEMVFYSGFETGEKEDVLVRCSLEEVVVRLGSKLSNDFDWAVIQINSEQDLPDPIFIKDDVFPEKAGRTYCLGHPFGLSLKLTWDGIITEVLPTSFRTKLASYGGHSGSPVFNEQGDVIGLLIGQDEEFVERKKKTFFPLPYTHSRYGAVCHSLATIGQFVEEYNNKNFKFNT